MIHWNIDKSIKMLKDVIIIIWISILLEEPSKTSKKVKS